MARAISVKVSTAKVIKALEDKIKSGKEAVANNEKKRKDYEKVEKAWAKEVGELAMKQVAKAEVHASENWRNEVSVQLQFPAGVIKFPEKPQMELERELGRYEIHAPGDRSQSRGHPT